MLLKKILTDAELQSKRVSLKIQQGDDEENFEEDIFFTNKRDIKKVKECFYPAFAKAILEADLNIGDPTVVQWSSYGNIYSHIIKIELV